MLKNNTSRCTGSNDSTICPQRESCLRYRQIEIDRHAWKRGVPAYIPYAHNLCYGDTFEFQIKFDLAEWHETMRNVSGDPIYHEQMRNRERAIDL